MSHSLPTRRVLVTGFDPFGREPVNPAFEAVRLLPDSLAGAEIRKLELPTSFQRSAQAVEEAMAACPADIVICVGQAGGRSCVTLEQVALNLAEARIPDNDGFQPQDRPVVPGGAPAWYATIPLKAARDAVRAAGLPCHISYSAGTYVCNALLYQVLNLCAERYPQTRVGFVHVPYSPAQAVDKPNGTPSMSLADMARSLEAVIAASL